MFVVSELTNYIFCERRNNFLLGQLLLEIGNGKNRGTFNTEANFEAFSLIIQLSFDSSFSTVLSGWPLENNSHAFRS